MGLLVETLAATDLLAGAAEETVVSFMLLGKSRDRPRGHTFWRSQAQPTSVVIPITGEAKSFARNAEGRELIYGFVGPGECSGLPSCVDGLPHPDTLEVTRAGEFFGISRDQFVRFMAERPPARELAVKAISQALRRDLQDREDVALRSVSERIARFLIEHSCVRQADGAKVLVNATQAELAARLGSVREVVARVLSRMTDRGLLAKVKRDLFIADWTGLCHEAGFTEDTANTLSRGLVSPDTRTCRFFLSANDPRKRGISNDPEVCREHLGDLSVCRSAGCPAAQDVA